MSNEEIQTAGREKPSRRRLMFVAKLAVTIFAFVLVALLADVSEAISLMRDQNLLLLVLAGAAVLGQIALGSFRWRAVLTASVQQDAARISAAEAFRLYYASIFFNAFLPGGSRGGAVLRAVSTRTLGVTTAAAVHSVVLDRMLALVALLLMALPAAPLIWNGLGINSTIVLIGLGVIAGSIFAWQVAVRVEAARPVVEPVLGFLTGFLNTIVELLRRPGSLALAVFFAVGAHVACCVSAWLVAQSIGIPLSLPHALILMPLVFLISTIPISVGGWGVREVGAIGLLGLVGVPGHEAVIVSLQFGVISTFMSLPGGLIWLAREPARRTA